MQPARTTQLTAPDRTAAFFISAVDNPQYFSISFASAGNYGNLGATTSPSTALFNCLKARDNYGLTKWQHPKRLYKQLRWAVVA